MSTSMQQKCLLFTENTKKTFPDCECKFTEELGKYYKQEQTVHKLQVATFWDIYI